MKKVDAEPYLIDPENLDEEVVRDKEIKIKGAHQRKINEGIATSYNLKSALKTYENSKRKLSHYESIRKTNLEDIILPQIKKDLNYIHNKYQEKEIYHKEKIIYLRQFFTSKQEAMAFNKKHLQSI